MLPDEHYKEQLSEIYLKSVVATARADLSKPERDYGVDWYVDEVQFKRGRVLRTGAKFAVQLKSTQRWNFDRSDKSIVYDLEAKTFNDLVELRDDSVPGFLVLMCLPLDLDAACRISHECVALRNCCFWFQPSGERTDNTASHRIRIPVNQAFSTTTVHDMFRMLRA